MTTSGATSDENAIKNIFVSVHSTAESVEQLNTTWLWSSLCLQIPFEQICVAFFNTLRPRQNGHNFADDTFNRIRMNENVRISIEFSLKFVPKGPINIIPAVVQIMAWRRPGDKPLSEPMLVRSLTHICVTLLQLVKIGTYHIFDWVNVLLKGVTNGIHLTLMVIRGLSDEGQYLGRLQSCPCRICQNQDYS